MARKAILIFTALSLLAAGAEILVLLRIPIPPGKLFALLESFSLVVGAFVALTQGGFIRQLRNWATASAVASFLLPFALLVPYLILGLGAGTFSWRALAKLSLYIAAPTVFLLPDRLHGKQQAGWRDFAAMLALGWPVASHWLDGIWVWPQDLYVFRPLFCVCLGGYAFLVVRNLEGVGYRLLLRAKDVWEAAVNFVAFATLGIPLGMALSFIHPHVNRFNVTAFGLQIIGIYLTVAIPEELLFRGILQNLLTKTIHTGPRGRYALIIASVIFGLSHLHHAPVPNWRYAIMATLAGLFYGNVYNVRGRTSASATTHALVDCVWRFWF
jgi:CAAX protease family protein